MVEWSVIHHKRQTKICPAMKYSKFNSWGDGPSWQCRKILNLPSPTDTPNRQLQMEQFSLQKTWQYLNSASTTKDKGPRWDGQERQICNLAKIPIPDAGTRGREGSHKVGASSWGTRDLCQQPGIPTLGIWARKMSPQNIHLCKTMELTSRKPKLL